MTPARAAAGKNGAAILCLHPGPETVFFGAVTIVGLKCSLRHDRFFQERPLWSGRNKSERHQKGGAIFSIGAARGGCQTARQTP
jgi:hypothetical protein